MSAPSAGLRPPMEFKPNDEKRRSFLDALDDSDRIEVTDWEAQFLESTIGKEVFTDGQRKVIETLMIHYEHRL